MNVKNGIFLWSTAISSLLMCSEKNIEALFNFCDKLARPSTFMQGNTKLPTKSEIATVLATEPLFHRTTCCCGVGCCTLHYTNYFCYGCIPMGAACCCTAALCLAYKNPRAAGAAYCITRQPKAAD